MDARKEKILAELGNISEDVYNELLQEVRSQAKNIVIQMKDAAARNDFKKLAELAHFLRGAASNLRVRSIAEICRDTETAAKEEAAPGRVSRAIERLETIVNEVDLLK